MKRLDSIISEYRDELYDYIANDYNGECERDYKIGNHAVFIICDRHNEVVEVYDEDGDEVTSKFANVCRYIKKNLKDAWQGIASEIETEDEHIDYWAMFGGYGLGGKVITL